jgi:hypothetical protein
VFSFSGQNSADAAMPEYLLVNIKLWSRFWTRRPASKLSTGTAPPAAPERCGVTESLDLPNAGFAG